MLIKIEYAVVVDAEFRKALAFWVDTDGAMPSVLFDWKFRLASQKEIKEFHKENGQAMKDDVLVHCQKWELDVREAEQSETG